MRRGVLSCFLILCLVGCTSGEKPDRGAFPTPPTVSQRVEPERKPVFVSTPDPRDVDIPPLREEEPEKEKERDLGQELLVAVGAPVDCVRDFEADEKTTIRIPVSATVRPTGMIIQPAAIGTGVSPKARRCVEQRVALVKLDPLEKPLSQTVSAVIEIEYTPPSVVEGVPSAPEPELRNVRDPLPKRAEVAPSGRPIQAPTSKPITARNAPRDPTGRAPKPIVGPKPRPIDGYEVDENAQQWR